MIHHFIYIEIFALFDEVRAGRAAQKTSSNIFLENKRKSCHLR
jgi:hypothetical protein